MIELTRSAVETWIRTIATGEFHYTKVLDGKVHPESYNKLRKIMYDIAHSLDPACETVGKRDGYYRPIQEPPQPMEWQQARSHTDFPVTLPLDIRKYVFIYPNTVIVVAGSKSSGKTGFLYRTVAISGITFTLG